MTDESIGKQPSINNLENEQSTELQKKLEKEIVQDEELLKGDELSGVLSQDRTHMSEHRTRMSEHRTSLSEKRTGMSETRTGLSGKRTILSFQRTALSYERTLMSWIRTAVSLITFGFTLYKFFQEYQQTEPVSNPLITPRELGIMMIGLGVTGLLFAQIQHTLAYKQLKVDYPQVQHSLSSILSILIIAIGLFLLAAALLRL